MEHHWPTDPVFDDDDTPDIRNYAYDIRKVMHTLHAQPIIAVSKKEPFDTNGEETFVLRHPDLDLQNILVDDDGNVTGNIDWDNCLAVPQCIG
jgi:hypothetical protein